MLSVYSIQGVLSQLERRDFSAFHSLQECLPQALAPQAATLLSAAVLAFGADAATFSVLGELFFDLKPGLIRARGVLPRPRPDSEWVLGESDSTRRALLALNPDPFDRFSYPLEVACAVPNLGAVSFFRDKLHKELPDFSRLMASRAFETAQRSCSALAAAATPSEAGQTQALDAVFAPIFSSLLTAGASPWSDHRSEFIATQSFFARQGLYACWLLGCEAVGRQRLECTAFWREVCVFSLVHVLGREDFSRALQAQRIAREALSALLPVGLFSCVPGKPSESRLPPKPLRLIELLCDGAQLGVFRLRSMAWILDAQRSGPSWEPLREALRLQWASAEAAAAILSSSGTSGRLGATPQPWTQLQEREDLRGALPQTLPQGGTHSARRL